MTQSGFIAVIDLGTSKITGIIGYKNDSNVISVMACQTLPSNGCIRRGIVYNVEETGAKVRLLINKLENSIGAKIAKVYVALAGQSIHTEMIMETKQLSSSGIVTESVISQMLSNAEKFMPDMKRKYAIADVEYFIDEKPEPNPVGVACTTVEAQYQAVVGRPNLVSTIEKVILEKAQLQVAGYIVGHIASSKICLTDDEKELGCAFIDFGAGTTTVSVYKSGILRRMVTIPFGGKNITKDISELNFVESEAEQYKTKFGKAKENSESKTFVSPFSTKLDIDLTELNKVIMMRLDEIIANVKEQIKQSGFEKQLGAGIIITGGASKLKNIDTFISQKFNNINVRKASAQKVFVNNAPDVANDPSLTTALGMLLFANENCEEKIIENIEQEIEVEQQDENHNEENKFSKMRAKVKKEKREEKSRSNSGKKLSSQIGSLFSGMFGDDDDDEE